MTIDGYVLVIIIFFTEKITILDPNCVVKTFPNILKNEKVTQPPIITIDGPSASGKGTISELLAKKTGFTKIDSGRFTEFFTIFFKEK